MWIYVIAQQWLTYLSEVFSKKSCTGVTDFFRAEEVSKTRLDKVAHQTVISRAVVCRAGGSQRLPPCSSQACGPVLRRTGKAAGRAVDLSGVRLPQALPVQQAADHKHLRVPCQTQITQNKTMKTKKTKLQSPTTSHTARGSLRRLSALAQQLAEQRKYGEAAAAIEQLFASDAPKDEGSAQLLAEARQSYFACQEELARQDRLAAAQVAAELQAETEKLAGFAIRVTFEDDAGGSGVQIAWEQGRDHHLVVCRTEPEELQPYELASALLRIQTETEAYRAGKSRFPTVSRRQTDDLLSLFDPQEAQRLAAEGGLWITLNPHPDDIALEPLRMLLGSTPYMLVDARLRQRYPVLRPAQFLSRSTAFLDGSQAREDCTEIPPTQKLRERVITAVDGLNGLYLDWLFGGVTDFAARYHDLDGFDLAQKLWQQWQSRFPAMQPGDEFALLDDFAGILGLSGRFGWVKVPFAAAGTQKPPPRGATSL